MKKETIIILFSTLVFAAFSSINIHRSLNTAKEVGYSNLKEIISIAKANAESSINCSGSACDDANGNKYNTGGIGDHVRCCGVANEVRGNKES